MLRKSNLSKSVIVGLLVLACVLTVLLSTRTVAGRSRKAPQGQSREGWHDDHSRGNRRSRFCSRDYDGSLSR